MVGGVTKRGNRTRAFSLGKKVTIEYLNNYIPEQNRVVSYRYQSRLTLKQAAYKKVSRSLSSFCKWENGRKYISEDAFDNIVTYTCSQNNRQEADNLSTTFRTLQLQLAEKDLQKGKGKEGDYKLSNGVFNC